MKYISPLLKFAAVWLALILAGVATGMLAPALPAGKDGPLNALQAMAVVSAIFAAVLSLLASRMKLAFWPRALSLFVVLYGAENVQSQIEAVFFNASIHMSPAVLAFVSLSGAVSAAAGALAAAWLWKPASVEPMRNLGGLWWKVPVISPIYVIFYFGAGAMIAWQSPAVRDYYAQGTSFEMPPLVALQFFRGVLWAALAAIAVKSVSGPAMLRALTVGLAFALFTVPILLYPNAFMPWPVREMHLIEVGSSNFLFGVLTGFILLVGKPKAGQPAAVHL